MTGNSAMTKAYFASRNYLKAHRVQRVVVTVAALSVAIPAAMVVGVVVGPFVCAALAVTDVNDAIYEWLTGDVYWDAYYTALTEKTRDAS